VASSWSFILQQFAQFNNVSIGVPSLSNLHTSEPNGRQNGATYSTRHRLKVTNVFFLYL